MTIAYNAFRDNELATNLSFVQGSSSAVYANGFSDSSSSHLVVANFASETLFVFDNDFLGSGALRAIVDGIVNAAFNYWGQSTGPLPSQLDEHSPAVIDVSEGSSVDPFFPSFP